MSLYNILTREKVNLLSLEEINNLSNEEIDLYVAREIKGFPKYNIIHADCQIKLILQKKYKAD